MSPRILFRASGVALLLGSLFGLIWMIMNAIVLPLTDANEFASPLFLLASLLLLIGSMSLVLGLVGMYAHQMIPVGWLGLVGFVLLFLGLLVAGVGLGLISATVIPWLTIQAPNLIVGQFPPLLYAFLVAAVLAIVVGSIPLGIAIMHARVLPRWAGLLLIASGVIGLVDLAPLESVWKNIIAALSATLFFVCLGWLGYALWSERKVEEVQAAVVADQATVEE